MSEKFRIRYRFESIEQWQAVRQQLRELIEKDTGEQDWVETRSLPPLGFPPPLTQECFEKLKKLDGVVVDKVDED